MRKIYLVLVSALLPACSFWEVANTTIDVLEHYPHDNKLEEMAEEHLEDYFNMESGSIDLSPFSPEVV